MMQEYFILRFLLGSLIRKYAIVLSAFIRKEGTLSFLVENIKIRSNSCRIFAVVRANYFNYRFSNVLANIEVQHGPI